MSDALDRLALAHALRTPLTSALLAVGVLHDGSSGALDGGQRDLLRAVLRDLLRLQELVDAGLETDLLGRHAGPMTRIDLDFSALVRSTVAPLVSRAMESNVRARVATSAVRVRADEVRIAWAVASIVGNALRYARSAIEVNVGLDDDEALLVVHDDGPGVPQKVAARLLTREGGGLGLVLVREVIEAHGGSIALESAPRRGTTVRVRLPLS